MTLKIVLLITHKYTTSNCKKTKIINILCDLIDKVDKYQNTEIQLEIVRKQHVLRNKHLQFSISIQLQSDLPINDICRTVFDHEEFVFCLSDSISKLILKVF